MSVESTTPKNNEPYANAFDFGTPKNIVEGIAAPSEMPHAFNYEVEKPYDVQSGILSLEQGFLDGVTLSAANIAESAIYTDAEKEYILQSKKDHPFLYGLGQVGGFTTLAAGVGAAVATGGSATPLEAGVGGALTVGVGRSIMSMVEAGAGAGAGNLVENFGSQALISSLNQSASNYILDPKTSDGQYLSTEINKYAQDAMIDTLTGATIGGGLWGAGLGLKQLGKAFDGSFKLYLDNKKLKYDPELEGLPNLNKDAKLYNPQKIQDFFGKKFAKEGMEDSTLLTDKMDNKASFLPSFQNSVNNMDIYLNKIEGLEKELNEAGVTDREVIRKSIATHIENNPELSDQAMHYSFLKYLSDGGKNATHVTRQLEDGNISFSEAFDSFKNLSNVVDIARENSKLYSTPDYKIKVDKDFTQAFRVGIRNLGENLDRKMYDFRENLTNSLNKSKENYFTNPVVNMLTAPKVINNAFGRNDGLFKSSFREIKNIEREMSLNESPDAVNKKVLGLVKTHIKKAIEKGAKTSEEVFDRIVDFNSFLSDVKYLAVNADTGMHIRLSGNDEKFLNGLKGKIKAFQTENFGVGADFVEKADLINRATGIYRNTMGFYDKKASMKLTQVLQKKDGVFTEGSLKQNKELLEKFAVRMTQSGKKGSKVAPDIKAPDISQALRDLNVLHDEIRYKYPELNPLVESMKTDIGKIHDNFNAAVFYNEERIAKIFGNTGEEVVKSLLPEGEMSLQSHISRAMLDLLEGNIRYAKMNLIRVVAGAGLKSAAEFFSEGSVKSIVAKQVEFTKNMAKQSNKMKNTVVQSAINATKDISSKIINKEKGSYKIGAISNLMLATQKGGPDKIDSDFQKHSIFYQGTQQDLASYQRYLINQTRVLKRLFPDFADEVVEQNNRKIGYLRQLLPKNYDVFTANQIALSEKVNYLDAYDAVFNPMKVVEMIGNGTVTKPQMTHFKNTNPFIYNEIKNEALSRIKSTTPREVSNRLYNLFDVISPVNLNKDMIDAGNIYNTIVAQQSQQNSNLVPKSSQKSRKPIKFSSQMGQLTPKTQD